MIDETVDLIDTLYGGKNSNQIQNTSEKNMRKSSKAKYQIFDESEFTVDDSEFRRMSQNSRRFESDLA